MQVLQAELMRRAEADLFASGTMDSFRLMELAVDSLAVAWRAYPDSSLFTHAAVYAGHGNNAGDALGLALALGLPCRVLMGDALSPDAQKMYERLVASALMVEELPVNARVLIIDGLLGTGAQGRLRPAMASRINDLNTQRAALRGSACLSIDVPSGLGLGGLCVRADVTACIGCVKAELVDDAAIDEVGALLPVPLPAVPLPSDASLGRVISSDTVSRCLPRRAHSTYKNKVGHVHVVAGSVGYLGAAQMAAESALYSGAGLVSLYALPDVYDLLAVRLSPEIILRRVSSYAELDVSGAQSLLIGPGLARPCAADLAALAELLSSNPCPVVLDADALRLLAEGALPLPADAVLTPHEGEMRALAGARGGSRLDWAQAFVATHPCTLLLKGARSLVMDKGSWAYNSSGGSFMANAGQGDCLAGCVASLRAQGLSSFDAACAGAWLCGRAAEWVRAGAHGCPNVLASQVIRALPAASRNLF